jgi:inorganic pyrophosphatase
MTGSVDPYRRLSPRADESGLVNVIIDTPRGSANKYKYDERLGIFKISRVLPAGMHFPHDFGFVPGTCAEDGDPLDVLVLLDAPSFAGCLVTARLIGGLHVEQFEKRRKVRNDRLIATPQTEVNEPDIRSLRQLGRSRLHEIEEFFVSYNRVQGRTLRVVSRFDARRAQTLLRAAIEAHRKTVP